MQRVLPIALSVLFSPMLVQAAEVTRSYVNAFGNRYEYGEVDQSQAVRAPYAERYGVVSKTGYGPGTQVQLDTGYRTGKLHWNIAGDQAGQNPNVLSELQWKNLNMAEIHGGIRTTVPSGFLKQARFEADGRYAYAVSGKNQDSDYMSDNRADEFSRSNNKADGSQAFAFKGAVGYDIPFVNRPDGVRFIATPLIGYRYEQQRLQVKDGNQTVCVSQPSIGFDCGGIPLGPFSGLDSRYNATWHGPFLGLETEAGTENHRLRVRGEVTGLNYSATAKWNLRPDLNPEKSFRHEATGTGLNLSADYTYQITPATGLTATAELEHFKADKDGIDRSYFVDGTTGDTKLNEAVWSSQAYRIGVEHKF